MSLASSIRTLSAKATYNEVPKSILENELHLIMELKANKIAELEQLKSLSQLCQSPNNPKPCPNLADMYQHISILTSSLQDFELKIQQICQAIGLSFAESLGKGLNKTHAIVQITTFSDRKPSKNLSAATPLHSLSLRSLVSMPIDIDSDDEVANITANYVHNHSKSPSAGIPVLAQSIRAPSTEPEIKVTSTARSLLTLPEAPLLQNNRHDMEIPTLFSFAPNIDKPR